jgi:hypothetical protein
MMTVVLSFLFMLVIVAGMAIGVMFGRKPIAGSCGGMKALGLDMQCDICGGDPNACESRQENGSGAASGLAREAVRGKRTL